MATAPVAPALDPTALGVVSRQLLDHVAKPVQPFSAKTCAQVGGVLGIDPDKRNVGTVLTTAIEAAKGRLAWAPRDIAERVGDAAVAMGASPAVRAMTVIGVDSLRYDKATDLATKIQAVGVANQASLEKLMFHIPAEKRPAAEAALVHFFQQMSQAVAFGSKRGDEDLGTEAALKAIGTRAGMAMVMGPEQTVERIGQLGKELVATLKPLVELSTAEAKDAFHELELDVQAVSKLMGGARALGSKLDDLCHRHFQKKDITVEKAIDELQPLAERLGIGVVKLLQKAGPYLAMFQAMSSKTQTGKEKDADFETAVLLGVVGRMQSRMTPMPKSVVISQLRLSFPGRKLFPGDEDEVDDVLSPGRKTKLSDPPVFLSLDLNDIGSASMAQVLCGWIIDPDDKTRAVEVAVKVFRVGAKEDIESTTRACALFSRVLHAYPAVQPEGTKLSENEAMGLKMAEGLIDLQLDYVQGFAAETNAPNERKETEESRMATRYHARTYVPRTFESYCGPTVITMERIRAPHHQPHLEKMKRAEKAAQEPLPTSAIAPTDSSEAERRMTLWGQQKFGLEALSCVATPDAQGFGVMMEFADSAHRQVKARIGLDGAVTSETKPPDLSKRALRKTLVGLLSEFFVQIVHRRLHGDGQGGNFLAAPQGTNVWIDWGKTIRFTLKDMLAPSRMVAGLLMGRKRMMARGLMAMSKQKDLPKDQRKAYEDKLIAEMERLQAERKARKTEEANGQATGPRPSANPRAAAFQESMMGMGWAFLDAQVAMKNVGVQQTSLYTELTGAVAAFVGNAWPIAVEAEVNKPLQLARVLAEVTGSVVWTLTKDFTIGWGKSTGPLETKAKKMRELGVLANYRPISDFPLATAA